MLPHVDNVNEAVPGKTYALPSLRFRLQILSILATAGFTACQAPLQDQDTSDVAEVVCTGETDTESWNPPTEIRLPVELLSQYSLSGEETLNCGETSLAMAAAYIGGYIPEYKQVCDLVRWMDQNLDYYEGNGETCEGSGSTPDELADAANGLYSLDAQAFNSRTHGGTLEALYEQLESGVPVIVATHTQPDGATDLMINNGTMHFMLVTGMIMKDGEWYVVLNDPLQTTAPEYKLNSFEECWRDSSGVSFLTTGE